MSVNAPPLMLISSTAPSKVSSRLNWWRNVSVVVPAGVNDGESSVKSFTAGRSVANAAFGAVSNAVVTVVKSLPVVVDVTQPAGSAGAVTSSKFSSGGNVPPTSAAKFATTVQ